MKPMFRVVDCAMDGCRCGLPHPAYRDCTLCLGTGYFMGGDELQPCPRCKREDAKAREASHRKVTLTRKMADPFRADVLRGERSPFDGEVS